MTRFRVVLILIGGLGASSGNAQSPPPDGSSAFFAGDWIGTGARDNFCFMRLRTDGTGTVLAMSASGDWLGARILWRNQRQSLIVTTVQPLPDDPRRRLAPLNRLTLSLGFGTTIHLILDKDSPICELQRRASVQQNIGEAEKLLNGAIDVPGNHGGK